MTSASTQIALHKPSGDLMLIQDARSGLDCKCVCLDCGEPLVAVHRSNVEHLPYFRHHREDSSNPCSFSGISRETHLHVVLKRAIQEEGRIHVPSIFITKESPSDIHRYKPFLAYKDRVIAFEQVDLEKREGEIIPDCIGCIHNKKLYIEVKVTHGIDDVKARYIETANASCVELYANYEMLADPKSAILNPANFEWISEVVTRRPEVVRASEEWFISEEQRILKLLAEQEAESERLRLQDLTNKRKRLFGRMLAKWEVEYRASHKLERMPLPHLDNIKRELPFDLLTEKSRIEEQIRVITYNEHARAKRQNERQRDAHAILGLAMPNAGGAHIAVLTISDRDEIIEYLVKEFDSQYETFIEDFCRRSQDKYTAIPEAIEAACMRNIFPASESMPLISKYASITTEGTYQPELDTPKILGLKEQRKNIMSKINLFFNDYESHLCSRFAITTKQAKIIAMEFEAMRFSSGYKILAKHHSEKFSEEIVRKMELAKDTYKRQLWQEIEYLSLSELNTRLNQRLK